MSTRKLAIPALFLSLALAAPVTMLEAASGRAGIHDAQGKKDRNRNQNRDRNQNQDRNEDRNEDRNDDRRCSESERLPMRFRGLDRNCDGVISRAEWRGSDVSFRQHDRNGDGMLSGSELLGNGDDRDDDRNGGGRFDRLDRNDDGRISLDEWPGRRAAFERLDRNDDGFLSRDEFSGDDD
jgi:Ca2+-binding EF-hand superfamily protein